MSPAQRRRGKSLHLELPGGASDERPSITALFLIQFDVKAGYTIAWKQSIPGLELVESVEFKSLPSGLHNVSEDLVYFMHDDQHAGISAFVNKSTDQWERNALMIAVGALVPLDQGRLGRSWKHADALKTMAQELVLDPSKTQILEDYWAENRIPDEDSRSTSRPGSSQASSSQPPRRNRAKSNASGVGLLSFGLSPHHPALSLPMLIDAFGPLVYPIYKAALLRKRILFMHEAPVEMACNFVYNTSILSNIPTSVADLIPLEPLPNRLQPLFSVGVHDIDQLAQKSPSSDGDFDPGYGWVACSTDDVLSVKTNIFDILVTIPPARTQKAKEKAWPTIKISKGKEMKASQRDLRRYRTLRHSLRRGLPRSSRGISPYSTRSANPQSTSVESPTTNDQTAFLSLELENTHETFDDASSTSDQKLIEPLSWSALAYNSFMWWASAGEKRADLDDEAEHDAAMFRDFDSYADAAPGGVRSRSSRRRRSSLGGASAMTPGMAMMTDGSPAAPEMAIIAYFHRLTAAILRTLAQVVDGADGGGEEDRDDGRQEEEAKDGGVELPPIYVGSEDMIRMGLDVWSEGDRRFVEELLELYWGRKADVQGGRIECCGVRIV